MDIRESTWGEREFTVGGKVRELIVIDACTQLAIREEAVGEG